MLDFSGVTEFVPVPLGRYLAEVATSREGISDRAGKKKWSLQFNVTEDPQHEGEYVGKTIKWDISLVPAALWKVKQTLEGLGEEIEKGEKKFDFDAERYVGRQCVIIVGTETSETYGERSKVQSVLPVSVWEPVAV